MDDGDENMGEMEGMLSEWRGFAVATAVGLAIFGGGTLMSAPRGGSAAMAAMAPSLMQDEKGYISIFEKVG